jgi:hypothetical protein
MTEQPHTPTLSGTPKTTRAVRTVTAEQMMLHLDSRHAVPLSPHPRQQLFVRYDNVWWVGHGTGFIEITDPEQNTKLDRWHHRLTHGALWA